MTVVRVNLVAVLTGQVAVNGWTSVGWTSELALGLTVEVVPVTLAAAVRELLAGLRLPVEVPAHEHVIARTGEGRQAGVVRMSSCWIE